MKKYAVAYMNYFVNDLKIKIVGADNWKDALIKGFGLGKVGWLKSEDLEEAKEEAFNSDCLIDAVEL